jgi:FHA domain-containing protein
MRPLVIGRAAECDLVVEDESVSRLHAYVLRTPTGYVVVDSSSQGTYVNFERIQAQQLLEPGDVIQIGGSSLRFDLVAGPIPEMEGDPTLTREWSEHSSRRLGTGKVGLMRALPQRKGRLREWVTRYGIAEVVGTCSALAAYWAMRTASGSELAGAYAAALAEGVGFYGTLLVRELIRDAYAAGGRRAAYGPRQMLRSWRNLFMEFGPAELVDAGITRPLCIRVAVGWLGSSLGVLTGKLAADVVFYGPVIAMYEIRQRTPRT